MMTMIQIGSGWAGADGAPGPVERAAVFSGPKQREEAFAWAGKTREFGSFDILTSVSPSERAEAMHIVCSCGKELQNGRGKISHGMCGACIRAYKEKLNAEVAA